MPTRRLTPLLILMLVSSDVLETTTLFCFKKSASGLNGLYIHHPIDALHFIQVLVSSPLLWAGLACIALAAVIWSTILSKIDLSLAVPLASLSYILVALVSVFLLHERITILRWLGMALIVAGIVLISGPPPAERESQ